MKEALLERIRLSGRCISLAMPATNNSSQSSHRFTTLAADITTVYLEIFRSLSECLGLFEKYCEIVIESEREKKNFPRMRRH